MNLNSVLARPLCTTIVAAASSLLVTTGLFTAVAGFFLRDGTPLQNVVVAERACGDFPFVSEQQACVRSFLATAQVRRVARR